MVYKRGKVWWYKFAQGGHNIRESTKQGNKRTAELLEAARKVELARGKAGLAIPTGKTPTMLEFADRFRRTIETECADKPNTIAFYHARLRYLLADEILANCPLDEINQGIIDAYKQRRTKTISNRKAPFAVASVNHELTTLRRVLKMAEDYELIPRVPKFKKLRGEHEREFVLSFAQETAYLAQVKGDLRDIAVLMIDTGLRIGEVLSLAVSDVRLTPAEGARYSFLTVRAENSKNSKSRNVPLSPRVAWMLENRIDGVETGLVFHRPDGQRLASTPLGVEHRRVRKLLKLSSEFVPHSFRHTYGTQLGESGVGESIIMKLMGHSSLKMVQRYVHPTPETVENAVERLETMRERKRAAFVVA